MNSPAIPRSPYVTALIQQTTGEVRAPAAHEVANDPFPLPAYIEDGLELDQALTSLGLERRPVRGAAKLTVAKAFGWLISAMTLAGALIVIVAALMTFLEQLQAISTGGPA